MNNPTHTIVRSAKLGLELEENDRLTLQRKDGKEFKFVRVNGETTHHGKTITGTVINVVTHIRYGQQTGDIKFSIQIDGHNGNTWFLLTKALKAYNVVEHIQTNKTIRNNALNKLDEKEKEVLGLK